MCVASTEQASDAVCVPRARAPPSHRSLALAICPLPTTARRRRVAARRRTIRRGDAPSSDRRSPSDRLRGHSASVVTPAMAVCRTSGAPPALLLALACLLVLPAALGLLVTKKGTERTILGASATH